MPDWLKVRADLKPESSGAYVLLDQKAFKPFMQSLIPASPSVPSGDADWTYPTILSAFNYYTGNACRYRKLSSGLVVLAGWGFVNGTNTVDESTPFFTLPIGYRPLPTIAGTTGLYGTYHYCAGSFEGRRVLVNRDGKVFFNGSTFASGDTWCLDGITFYPQQ